MLSHGPLATVPFLIRISSSSVSFLNTAIMMWLSCLPHIIFFLSVSICFALIFAFYGESETMRYVTCVPCPSGQCIALCNEHSVSSVQVMFPSFPVCRTGVGN